MFDLLGKLLKPLVDAIKRALGPFGKLFDLVGKFFTGFREAFTTGQELTSEIVSEISEWRNFRENIHVRTRVISLPAAIENTQALLDQIKAAWAAVVDLGRKIREQAQGETEDPTVEAESAIKDIESSGVKGLLEKLPALGKALEKLLGFLAIAISILETLKDSINDLKAIVDAIKGIREEIETGSTVFLSQSNPRQSVTLEDGTKMKIRIGNLH